MVKKIYIQKGFIKLIMPQVNIRNESLWNKSKKKDELHKALYQHKSETYIEVDVSIQLKELNKQF